MASRGDGWSRLYRDLMAEQRAAYEAERARRSFDRRMEALRRTLDQGGPRWGRITTRPIEASPQAAVEILLDQVRQDSGIPRRGTR